MSIDKLIYISLLLIFSSTICANSQDNISISVIVESKKHSFSELNQCLTDTFEQDPRVDVRTSGYVTVRILGTRVENMLVASTLVERKAHTPLAVSMVARRDTSLAIQVGQLLNNNTVIKGYFIHSALDGGYGFTRLCNDIASAVYDHAIYDLLARQQK